MRDSITKSAAPLFAVALVLATTSGCGQSRGAYQPSGSEAREALEAALAAWKDGKPPTALDGLTPAVHPVDSRWQAGQVLENFEIVKEEPSEEAAKAFLVRLSLKAAASKPAKAVAGPAASEVRYIVVGRGPIWVYREEDYARVLNMEDNPRAARPTRPRPR